MKRLFLALAFTVTSVILAVLAWLIYTANDKFTATALFTCAIISLIGGILIIKNKDL